MNSEYSWNEVKKQVQAARYCALATTGPDGTPRMTPIGCIHLTEEGRGFFIEEHPALLPGRLDSEGPLAIVAIGSCQSGELHSDLIPASTLPTALRLVVKASRRRIATPAETTLWSRLVSPFRWLRGQTKSLRRELRYARDFTVDAVLPIHLGAFAK